MALSRFRELLRKQIDGTLSGDEAAEFDVLLATRAKQLFDTCPACRGAFSLNDRVGQQVRCPQCGTVLECFTSDLPGHQNCQVDPTSEAEQRLGVFSAGYAVPGTIPCLDCGIVYPRNYSCCPGQFLIAIELIGSGTKRNQETAIAFLELHSPTLLNSLRGGFVECFESRHRILLLKHAAALGCGDELKSILEAIN